MKKYRLTDQRTLLGILSKLNSTVLIDPETKQKFGIKDPNAVGDMVKAVHFTLYSQEAVQTKPKTLTCVLKENRVELRVKQVNPYQEDLFHVTEILIEPLERSAKRANIESVSAYDLKMAQTADLGTVISVYGKTSIINQALNQWQVHLEQTLTHYGYFIKKIQIGFFYAAETVLMESLAQSKVPFYIRDANRKIFYTNRGFYSTKKLSEIYVRSYLESLLLNNIKSVLIFPVFSTSKVLLGYFEISSNLPDLGNAALQEDIEGDSGIGPLMDFLDQKAEEFVFQLEFAYAKDWEVVAKATSIRDISQDGRGIGIYLPNEALLEGKNFGAPVSFVTMINSLPYTFYGSMRNIKKSDYDLPSIGVQIFQCDRADGLPLLARYASNLIEETMV